MVDTPRHGLTQLEESQALPENVVNGNDIILEQMANGAIVKDKDLTAPPGSPVDGDAYIVDATATGAWAGHEDDIAFYYSGWEFVTPIEGTEAYVQDENLKYRFDGSGWVNASGATSLDDLSDVNAPTPANGEVLTWDSTPGEWVAQALPGAGSFVLGDATDVDTTGAASGNVLTYDGSQWEPAAPTGASWALVGAGQTAAGVWDFAVDGAKANVDFTGLAGYKDFLIIARNVTKASTGLLVLQVSVNNGSSWYTTSGDYVFLPNTGAEANNPYFASFHVTNATAARSGVVSLPAAGIAGVVKASDPITVGAGTADGGRLFVASTSAINALRISGTGGGNLTGGAIYVLAR